MSHIAIQEALGRNVVDWLEKVTDEEYLAESAQRNEPGDLSSGQRNLK
jgi:hypothetical protein